MNTNVQTQWDPIWSWSLVLDERAALIIIAVVVVALVVLAVSARKRRKP
jgi:hypothetical protein